MKWLGSLAVVMVLAWGAVAAAADKRPNIVFVQTDDQAPWAVGVANPMVKTPHMDRLFREGAYLVNSFTVTPVCSPSRASLMTSRYGTELGITDWIHPKREPTLGLSPDLVTFPELLQEAGYQTGLVGKWHLGTEDRYHPTKAGFDYFMGHREGGWSTANPTLEKNGVMTPFKGLTADILCEESIEFLKRNQKRPFFLAWHTRAPHTQWLPVAEEDWAPYENLDPKLPHPDYPNLDVQRAKRMTREYLASVGSVDRNLGRFLKVLDELGLKENTVVIFTSDHGYNMAHNGIWHKGNGHWLLTKNPPATENIPAGQRPNMYDTSIKVPSAVRWPGRIRAGTRVEETISNLDWYPTVLAMAGVKVPDEVLIRGRNFLGLLEGKPDPAWNPDFYGEYSTKHQSKTQMRVYRTPEWKLIRDFLNPERAEFFDLRKDPEERRNLIGMDTPEIRKVIADLDGKIAGKMREVGE